MRHIEAVMYEFKYGNKYHEKEFYFEPHINLKQGKLIVDEYTSRYQELEILCGLWGSNKNDGARYINRLRPSIQAKVNFCETIPEAYKEAIRVERML